MTILQYVSWSSKSSPEHFLLHLRQGQILPFVSRDAEGRSVLHFAAQRGNLSILNYVLSLSRHVDVDARDIRGQTPLHYAVQCKRTETIDLLVARGSRVRAIDTNGCTVLHCAVMHNNVAAIKRLLELGAADDLLLLDRDERTPFQVALRWKASESVQYIMDLGIQGTYGQPTDIAPPSQARHRGLRDNGQFRERAPFAIRQIQVETSYHRCSRLHHPIRCLPLIHNSAMDLSCNNRRRQIVERLYYSVVV